MKNNLLPMGILSLLLIGLFSMTSCEKEAELLPFEIANNALQGTWELKSVAFNGESESVESGEALITFTASETDQKGGTVLFKEVNTPDDTDTYIISEDGKTIDLWDEIADLSVNSTDLKITNFQEDEGVINIYESNWKKK